MTNQVQPSREARKRMLILGATSLVAQHIARAADGWDLALVARDAPKLDAVERDLRARGHDTWSAAEDLASVDRHEDLLSRAWAWRDGFDYVLVAFGVYAEGNESEATSTLVRLFETNLIATAHLTIRVVERFEEQGRGRVAIISSVAGDRGRARNYVYGASKGGLSTFLQGLDHKLSVEGRIDVQVVDIKLGMIDTPMTAHLPPSPVKASPQSVAKAMLHAIEHGSGRVYVPGYWRWIMRVVRLLPRSVMSRIRA